MFNVIFRLLVYSQLSLNIMALVSDYNRIYIYTYVLNISRVGSILYSIGMNCIFRTA